MQLPHQLGCCCSTKQQQQQQSAHLFEQVIEGCAAIGFYLGCRFPPGCLLHALWGGPGCCLRGHEPAQPADLAHIAGNKLMN